MPTTTIPLVGEETRRGLAWSTSGSKDQYFGACVFTRMSNEATKSANWYVEKRPGVISGAHATAGSVGTAIWYSPSTLRTITAFGGSNSVIYDNTTNAGTISGVCNNITETLINGSTYYLLTSSDGTGWYLVNGAINDTSFTGDTHTNTVIDNIAGASGIYVGQLITGSGIQAGTRVATRTPDTSTPTSITTTIATTATASITITKEPIAKIISANFPSVVGGFATMDGYIFALTATARIYNSAVNDITTWGASDYIQANAATDQGVNIVEHKNHIVAFGSTSTEFFYNAGNAFGSILSSRKELFSNIGMYPASSGSNVVCLLNDNVFWIGNDFCLYTFDGLSPRNLSPQGIKLGTTSTPANFIYAFRIGADTIVHLGVTNSSAQDKWFSVYSGGWFEPNIGVSTLRIANISNSLNTNIALAVSSINTSGNLYGLDTATYQDDSAAFTMTIQTQPYSLNKGDPFIVKRVRLLADNQASGTTNLDMSADDYATFVDVGDFDMTSTQKEVWGGLYCESTCAFKLEHSANTAWRGQAIIVDWEPSRV